MDIFIQGAAGKVNGFLGYPEESLYVNDTLGFAILSIDADLMQIEFFDEDGMVHYQTSIVFADAR